MPTIVLFSSLPLVFVVISLTLDESSDLWNSFWKVNKSRALFHLVIATDPVYIYRKAKNNNIIREFC